MLQLFDAHCHLQDERLLADLPQALARAHAVGVRRLLCCGTCEHDWPAVRELARAQPEIVPSFGLHPWYLAERSGQWVDALEKCLAEIPAGVGEIGLDHAVVARNDAEQEEVFLAQLRLARKLRRPVSVHCRKAWGRLLELLRAEGGLAAGGILHSYSGPPDLTGELEALGFYISFSGVITRSGNKRGRRAAQAVSAERLLIETDSPDLAPVGAASAVNEPANLVRVAEALAGIRNISVAALAEQTFANASRLLQLDSPRNTRKNTEARVENNII
jgi:TatD DNase family protein